METFFQDFRAFPLPPQICPLLSSPSDNWPCVSDQLPPLSAYLFSTAGRSMMFNAVVIQNNSCSGGPDRSYSTMSCCVRRQRKKLLFMRLFHRTVLFSALSESRSQKGGMSWGGRESLLSFSSTICLLCVNMVVGNCFPRSPCATEKRAPELTKKTLNAERLLFVGTDGLSISVFRSQEKRGSHRRSSCEPIIQPKLGPQNYCLFKDISLPN